MVLKYEDTELCLKRPSLFKLTENQKMAHRSHLLFNQASKLCLRSPRVDHNTSCDSHQIQENTAPKKNNRFPSGAGGLQRGEGSRIGTVWKYRNMRGRLLDPNSKK